MDENIICYRHKYENINISIFWTHSYIFWRFIVFVYKKWPNIIWQVILWANIHCVNFPLSLISRASWCTVHMAWHTSKVCSPLHNSQQENSISDHKYDRSEWDMQKSNPTKSQKSLQHKRYIVPRKNMLGWAKIIYCTQRPRNRTEKIMTNHFS